MTALGAQAHVVAFVASSDLARSQAFYGDTLGLAVVAADDYGLVLDGGGSEIRVSRVEAPVVAPYTVLGWTVDDIAGAIGRLTALGVAVLQFEGMDQDHLGIWTAPGGARIAWFPDPDGHVLSLTQPA